MKAIQIQIAHKFKNQMHLNEIKKKNPPGSLWLQNIQPQHQVEVTFVSLNFLCKHVCYDNKQKGAGLPDVGPRCDILPSHGRGCGPGSNTDNIRFDFFLLSAWEYSIPNHSGLKEETSVIFFFFLLSLLQLLGIILGVSHCIKICTHVYWDKRPLLSHPSWTTATMPSTFKLPCRSTQKFGLLPAI